MRVDTPDAVSMLLSKLGGSQILSTTAASALGEMKSADEETARALEAAAGEFLCARSLKAAATEAARRIRSRQAD